MELGVLAVLTARDFGEYEVIMLDLTERGERVAKIEMVEFSEKTYFGIFGKLWQLGKQEFIMKGIDMRNVHVWRKGQLKARALAILGELYVTSSMAVMENVLGFAQLLALSFYGGNRIGIFAIDQKQLLYVRAVHLEFRPFSILWVANLNILLFGQQHRVNDQLFALSVNDKEVTQDHVTLEGVYYKLHIRSWCLWRNQSTGETSLLVIDKSCQSLKILNFAGKYNCSL